MIEYERFLKFCEKYGLSFEQFMLMYTINLRNQNSRPDLHEFMAKYYSGKMNTNWYEMVESLAERDFITILDRKKDLRKFLIKDLRLTDKFVNLLSIDVDEVWIKFVERYPLTGISPNGLGTFDSAISQDAEIDKQYFLRNVLRDSSRKGVDEILSTMENMFKWNGVKATEYARVGISRFLRNWDTYLRMHKEKTEIEDKASRRSTRL